MGAGVIRVAHLMHGLMMGGLEQVVVRLAEAGRPLGIEPRVIAFGSDGPVRGQLEARRIPLTHLGEAPGMSPQVLHGIGRTLREQRIAVVHAHDLGPWLNALGGRAMAPGVKTAVTFHQVSAPEGLLRGVAKGAALMTDALVACGGEVLSSLRGWVPSGARVELIGNGVPLGDLPSPLQRQAARARMGVPAEALVMGYLGRLHPEKGVDLLVEAFCARLAERQDLHLVLIGQGPLEPQLRRRAQGQGRIHFLGEVVEAASLLAGLDVYVQPSRREGRSLSMLEAMAAGLPTVAQALPAVQETHLPERTALLVPPGERPPLAEAILRLLDDPPLRARLGREARQQVQAFSVTAMVEAYAALYRRLAGTDAPRRAAGGAR